MEAHADDLRVEIQDNPAADALLEALKQDYRSAPLSSADRGMLDYAVKLTRTPQDMSERDVEALRGHGFDDKAIHDIAQVTALFNYYNRIADGLGIDLEESMKPGTGEQPSTATNPSRVCLEKVEPPT